MDWHRALGIAIACRFHNTLWKVEIEKDVAVRAQLLDVLIVRRFEGPDLQPRPDGLDDMADHNLITYKSLRETLDDWVLKELTGHYVNYRKDVSQAPNNLLDESHFHMYAVSTRRPEKLMRQLSVVQRSSGVYDVRRGTDEIRLIVVSEIPRTPHNSLWLLFSGDSASVDFGRRHFDGGTDQMSAVFQELLLLYQQENVPMPYTMEDFRKEHASHLTEEDLQNAPPFQELKKRAEAAERRASENLDRGAIVGEINTYQKLLGQPLTPREQLLGKTDGELKTMAQELARSWTNR